METTPHKSAAGAAAVLTPRAPSPEARDAPTMKAAAGHPRPRRARWRRILIIYAILGLAWFAFPGGLVDWLDERNATGWLDRAARARARHRRGFGGNRREGRRASLRKRFAAIIGDDEG